MATLTVWKLDSATGASEAVETVKRLQQQELLQLQDAAVITWPANAKKPTIHQLNQLVGAGALGGAFWGLLFGLLFFVPLLGAAIGAGIGALVASTADVGIDDKFIRDIRSKITPGTSALFLLTSNAVADRVVPEMAAYRGHMELIESNLSREDEAKLRQIFGGDGAAPAAPAAPETPTEPAAAPAAATTAAATPTEPTAPAPTEPAGAPAASTAVAIPPEPTEAPAAPTAVGAATEPTTAPAAPGAVSETPRVETPATDGTGHEYEPEERAAA
jgi:uncharacterized membrane protein